MKTKIAVERFNSTVKEIDIIKNFPQIWTDLYLYLQLGFSQVPKKRSLILFIVDIKSIIKLFKFYLLIVVGSPTADAATT